MYGIVVVSHSKKITDGIVELINEMTHNSVKTISAGGTEDGRLGTSATFIMEQINSCVDCNRILIFCDMGSSILSSETALELLEPEVRKKCIMVDGPIVEGAFVAAVQSMVTDELDEILREVKNI
ncbi:dihydroxyacetone kinase phosphoryl donor subunit DhaM [Caldifermentibacillus hisashii]|jgi:dihydroxyacetone kinase phosphotransfer subunit|uniref:phosphoenolpyruvate--glycerone phosphotransferase n=1 Tax=Caldifermentibacillus hisashii TaxID=996558 RepID=A0ABU9JTE1_9BACI|nr:MULTISPECIES: dihydroxyacetone kinase phosphoryl donor subunit DhaM [Bacillaceae]MCM3054878.1 dihydroxyacetone kinase phosphoryl donor subunit DhaM [Caldibacillus thermoamylovorans]MED4853043.1 dihydroxyacetone kinase phosphoryl donor subunit DhaM [Caldifermentibacillus hisashii]